VRHLCASLLGKTEVDADVRAETAILLGILRHHACAAALVGMPPVDQDGPVRLVMLEDNARRDADKTRRRLSDAVRSQKDAMIAAALDRAGLSPRILQPLDSSSVSLAPPAEDLRTRLSTHIVLLLVMMLVVGALYPAVELIAGERERGTLESLLSWPVHRRDVFLGKLLTTGTAALITAVANLTSLVITVVLVGSQLAAAGLSVGSCGSLLPALLLALLLLIPMAVTVSTLALALSGLAASVKEAQYYLTPLLLVVMVLVVSGGDGGLQPGYVLDCIPITGTVTVMQHILTGHATPWVHVALVMLSNTVVAVALIILASRFMDSERFCYPGLVRAGWGRFRRWGAKPEGHGALEALAVFSVALGIFVLSSGSAARLPGVWPVVTPLLLLLIPVLAHMWLGAYRPAVALLLTRPAPLDLVRAVMAVPCALLVSVSIAALQPSPPAGFTEALGSLQALAEQPWPITICALAVVPALCEETLLRGTVLTGLRRSLGPMAAVGISALLFAAMHFTPWRFLPQFVMGVALAILALRSGSLWPAVLLHAGHNALALMAGTYVASFVEDNAPFSAIGMLAMGLVGLWLCLGILRGNNSRGRS
jgi:sodium transport system permease protein